MKLSPHLMAAALAAATLVSPVASQAAEPKPPTAEDFARVPAVSQLQLSPDGKHMAALTSQDGEEVHISIWRTDAPGETPQVIGANKHTRYVGLGFLKNDRLLVTAIQTFTTGATRTHLYKQYVTDFSGKEWRSLMPAERSHSEAVEFYNRLADADVISRLPQDPRNVLVVDNRVDGGGDIYKVDVYSGKATRVERGSSKFVAPQADVTGAIRANLSLDYDNGAVYLAQWIVNPDTGKLEEHFRWYAKDREAAEVVGFSTDPNIAYVLTNRGQDKAAIFSYDIRARKILEPLFQHKLFDATGVIQDDSGRLLGFTYAAETNKVFWIDPQVASLSKGLKDALGVETTKVDWIDPGDGERATIEVADGADVYISDWSDSRQRLVVVKTGARQPTEYFLLRADNTLMKLGDSRPWIDTTMLGDTRLVEYRARDGLMIPAFLTTPRPEFYGAGPYPTLILPHGGPWARDSMGWDFSGWTQYFAARGYAVLQPQFRGSEGWGQKLWRAGDGEWGQKMQDDKDDGARWLIEQKIAAPDRIAMHGYSYGGYAALAAAIRPNSLYQCAIAGAGAGDLQAISRATFDNRFQREFQHPTIKGLDALEHAKEASIPVFIYHGDRDQTVELKQSKEFAAKLKSAGLPYKYLEIEDMGHQGDKWTPEMIALVLKEVENYLKTDCGPGGL